MHPLTIPTEPVGSIPRPLELIEAVRAHERGEIHRAALDALFDGFDAIVTPASLGTAPLGLVHTGDPLMCTLWTLLGLPALSLPLLRGANGLPLGVQLVGRFDGDGPLLAAATALMSRPREL